MRDVRFYHASWGNSDLAQCCRQEIKIVIINSNQGASYIGTPGARVGEGVHAHHMLSQIHSRTIWGQYVKTKKAAEREGAIIENNRLC
jgi:hypothetical protein